MQRHMHHLFCPVDSMRKYEVHTSIRNSILPLTKVPEWIFRVISSTTPEPCSPRICVAFSDPFSLPQGIGKCHMAGGGIFHPDFFEKFSLQRELPYPPLTMSGSL